MKVGGTWVLARTWEGIVRELQFDCLIFEASNSYSSFESLQSYTTISSHLDHGYREYIRTRAASLPRSPSYSQRLACSAQNGTGQHSPHDPGVTGSGTLCMPVDSLSIHAAIGIQFL